MSKKRLGLVLGLGLALALLVSACGVALGPVQFSAGGPMVQPVLSGWQTLVGAQPRATAHAMLHVQAFVAPEEQYLVDGVGVHFCHGEP
jgi:hypothetical protein